MTNKKLGDALVNVFEGVERDTISKLNVRDRVEEDHITTTVFTLLEERISNYAFSGLSIRARQFQGRGPNSDESITGADGALILNVKLQDIAFRKFYIFQAKNCKDNSAKFDARAVDQKYRMLVLTPASFFLIYTPKKFYFISAFLVGIDNKINKLPAKKFSDFHKDFFNCFIGDHSLGFRFFPFHMAPRCWMFLEKLPKPLMFDEKTPFANRNIQIDILSKE